MNRIALIGAILGVLIVADGLYMVATNYNDGETQSGGLLGSGGLLDGWILVISAAIILVASVLAFFLLDRPAKPAAAAAPQPVASASQPAATSEATSEQA
jgi:hypothetical protein